MFAYYRCEDYLGDELINWKNITLLRKQTEVDKIMTYINNPAFLQKGATVTGYSDAERNVTPGDIVNSMLELGFGYPDLVYTPYFSVLQATQSYNRLKDILRGDNSTSNPGAPVIMCANPKNPSTSETSDYFQYWIVDGFVDIESARMVDHQIVSPFALKPTLFHCVWGKDDYLDGYYSYQFKNYEIENKIIDYANKQDIIIEEQCLFPKPGAIGGYIAPVPTQPAF